MIGFLSLNLDDSLSGLIFEFSRSMKIDNCNHIQADGDYFGLNIPTSFTSPDVPGVIQRLDFAVSDSLMEANK